MRCTGREKTCFFPRKACGKRRSDQKPLCAFVLEKSKPYGLWADLEKTRDAGKARAEDAPSPFCGGQLKPCPR